MKRDILLLITVVTLMIAGCADKKKITARGQNGIKSRVHGNHTNSNSYGYSGANNVDPYGRGNYGNRGSIDGNRGLNSDHSGFSSGLENIYFDVNQYNITADELPTIYSNAKILRSKKNRGVKVKIEGHCDASGSDEYNYALGLRRAKSAKEALLDRGVDADNILIVSMGESSPECIDSSSASCYAKNRRVEFKLVK